MEQANQGLSLYVRSSKKFCRVRPQDDPHTTEIQEYGPEFIYSEVSPDGNWGVGYTEENQFSIFSTDGSGKSIEGEFKDGINSGFFSFTSKYCVFCHGTGKNMSSTIIDVIKGDKYKIHHGFTKSDRKFTCFTTGDEYLVSQIAPNKVEVFKPSGGFKSLHKFNIIPSIRIAGILNSEQPYFYGINVDAQEDGEKGCKFEIYNAQTKETFVSEFYEGDQNIEAFPSPAGDRVLILSHKFVDESGLSYYGQNTLSLIKFSTGRKRNTITYYGCIHSINWKAQGDHFAVCSGVMPAHVVIYNAKGDAITLVGRFTKNNVSWSPNGEFMAIGGFGNLNGSVDIYDVAKERIRGSCTHSCSGGLKWAPDGEHFMTHIVFSYLREQNEYKIFNSKGQQVNHVKFTGMELSSVDWHPVGTLAKITRSLVNNAGTQKKKANFIREDDFFAQMKKNINMTSDADDKPKRIKIKDIIKFNADYCKSKGIEAPKFKKKKGQDQAGTKTKKDQKKGGAEGGAKKKKKKKKKKGGFTYSVN